MRGAKKEIIILLASRLGIAFPKEMIDELVAGTTAMEEKWAITQLIRQRAAGLATFAGKAAGKGRDAESINTEEANVIWEDDGLENPDDEHETGWEDWDQCPAAESGTGSSTEVVHGAAVVQGFVMPSLRTE